MWIGFFFNFFFTIHKHQNFQAKTLLNIKKSISKPLKKIFAPNSFLHFSKNEKKGL